MNTYEFGKFLCQLRKEKGLTQLQLAEKLNVTDKAISRWETVKTTLRYEGYIITKDGERVEYLQEKTFDFELCSEKRFFTDKL